MKKSLRFLCVAALAMAAAFSSCQKQDMELPSEESVSSEATRASSFSSKYGIDWDNIAVIRPGSEYTAISSLRATSDKNYLYLLVKVDASQLSSGSTHHYDNFLSVYLYDSNGSSAGDWKEGPVSRVDNLCGWLVKDRKPYFTYWGDGVNRQVVEVSGTYYYEIRYPRSLSSLLSKSSVWLGVTLSNRYYRNDGSYSSQNSIIGRVPSKGKALYWLSMSSSGSTSNNDTPSNSGDSNHCSDIGKTPIVMAYLTYWTDKNMTMVPDYLTHVNFFNGQFVKSSSGSYDGSVKIEDYNGILDKVMKMKKSKSDLKVILAIGGWEEDGFSQMAGSSSKRKTFCQSCYDIVNKAYTIDGKKYYIDGIDLDWEYPTQTADGKIAASSSDTENFNTVLKELRAKLGNKKIISIASPSNAKYIDWKTAMQYVDYVNVMSYDMGNNSYHNSSLYWYDGCKIADAKKHTCEGAIANHVNAGIPKNKLNLGVPFYGHGRSPYKYEVAYRELSSVLNGVSSKYKVEKWDDKAKVVYYGKSDGSLYLSIENEASVKAKGEYARKNGLLGAMIWEYGQDDSNHTLLKALYKSVRP